MGVEGCEHQFCRKCLTNHYKHAVSVRKMPIGCPTSASDQYGNVLRESQIQDLLCASQVDLRVMKSTKKHATE
jgi:hypothetical protein